MIGCHRVPRAAALLLVLLTVALTAIVVAPPSGSVQAGVYFNSTEYTYKEYWADHASFTSGCGEHETAGGSWYIEPQAGCSKSIELYIPDDVGHAIAAVVTVDLWRNRVSKTARFTINDGPQFRPQIGQNFSRTPFTATVPLTQLRQGSNILKFQESTGPYHVHDAMIRVYYDETNPLIPGPNSDVTPPAGSLTGIRDGNGTTFAPGVGGTLAVDGNQVALTANASGAAYVEFHAFYDGYDEDNDGQTLDWHNTTRNNFGPGGTTPRSTGATIGHIGTDATAPYDVNWNLSAITNQTGVKFKIRVVDGAGNVREAAGGASAPFTLKRSYSVERYSIPGFTDAGLFFDGTMSQAASATIRLPDDLASVSRAILLGNYWLSPDVSINDGPPFPAYVGAEDTWTTSRRELDVSQLRPGANTIRWNYRPPGFGAMVEGPGPSIVIHRTPPSGPPQITTQPVGALVATGRTATLSVTATGGGGLAYQWMRNESPIVGATSATYTTPALSAADDGVGYRVRVQNGLGTVTSDVAVVNVGTAPDEAAPWWDGRWSYRTALVVSPMGVRRTDKIVTQRLDMTSLMRVAGSGGPTFDPNSIRVVEIDAAGSVIDPAVPFQFDPAETYDPVDSAVGNLLWQMTGVTAPNTARRYHVYFDKTSKAIPPAVVAPAVRRTTTTDEGFAAYRFDLADGSSWFFHHLDGGGFSSIVDRTGADWLGWNSQPGSAGDYRGLPNAVKGSGGYMHPGRPARTTTKILREGPLRIAFETTSKDNAWTAVWEMYPAYATFRMTKAPSRFWFLYEGLPGGELDAGDFIRRSDGTEVSAATGTFEADLPGREWMYVADPADGRSLYLAHHQDDGAVESYWVLDGAMPVLGFGRGGLSRNFPYLRTVEDGSPQTFTVGLADSVAVPATSATIDDAERPLDVGVGVSQFNGANVGPQSDDFSGPTLDPMWTYSDPVGDVGWSLDGSRLSLRLPAGPGHDLWHSRNTAPRVVQTVGNVDVDVIAAFDSVPTLKGTGQGLIAVQDSSTWIRYTLEHDGTQIRVAAYLTRNGTTTTLSKTTLPGSATRFLRLVRIGDTWRFRRSFNGTAWTDLPTANVPMNLTSIGVAGIAYTAGSSPAYEVLVDSFESRTAGPFTDDAPKLTDVRIESSARRAVVTWRTNVAADSRLAWGPTIDVTRSAVDARRSTEHSITLDFLRCDTPYWFQPTAVSTTGSTVGAVVGFRTAPCPTLRSDDFSTGAVSPVWRVVDPVGDAIVDSSPTNVIVSLPSGSSHNLFTGDNRAVRLRQEGPVGDFGVEAKFESVLTSRFQMQGIVVEEDVDSFLRFEVHHDGSAVRTYVASVLDGVATTHAYGTVVASPAHYVRVARTGNTWTMWYSDDGLAWSVQAELSVGIESAYVGPYIGNTSTGSGSPPAFAGSIDYFFDMAVPLDGDDGGSGPDSAPPTISALAESVGSPTTHSARVVWTTDEPATSRVEWGVTTAYSSGTVIDNRVVRSHAMTMEPLNCGVTYRYRVHSVDATGNAAASPDRALTAPPCPTGAFSDNFDSVALDPRWFVDDPRRDGTVRALNGLLALGVPAGVRHDLTASSNTAVRALQAVPNGDFQVMVGFESVVNHQSQIQGLIFEQDDNNLVRFDLYSDGSTTKAFVGTLTSGPAKLSTFATANVPGAVPGALRVTRTGPVWRFEYSPDRGQTWQLVHQGTVALSVARVGPYVGNANASVANIPAHTALVDYFWTTADPIPITLPGNASSPQFTVFGSDGSTWTGSPLRFGDVGLAQPDINVLGRVVDPDGINSLTYSVNGNEPITMGIGTTTCAVGVSCTLRLALDGDFNADIPVSELRPGSNTVTLRAIDREFNIGTIDIPVHYTPGTAWPLPYTADWSTTTDLHSIAQPIDGRWVIDDGALRVDEIGYDRLIAVGDAGWTSFEAQVPVTIERWDPAGYEAPSGGPGIGFIPHWKGHTAAGTTQPKYGFLGRLGALAWYRYRRDVNAERLEIRDSTTFLAAEDLSGMRLSVGVPYIFKLRAESGTATTGPIYSLKIWPAGTAEPAAWNLRTALAPGSVDSGSLALVAHHVAARFGTLTVREITAEAPTITPATGTFAGLQKVTMSTPTLGGVIRYTLDGAVPTASSPQYVEPFFVDRTTTVTARTFRAGFLPSAPASATHTITAAPPRVEAQLQALYRFDEGSGSTIADTSFAGEPADLVVWPGSNVTWLPDTQALRVNGPSLLRTAASASRINTAIKASQAVTVEMWIDPAAGVPSNATLFNLSTETPGQQNLALSQQGLAVEAALRTTNTDTDGRPVLTTGGVGQTQLHHLVYSRASDGATKVYVDGAAVYSGVRKGSLSGWANGYALALANSVEGVNPWIGDLHLTAVYSTALTPAQVEQNFRAGPFPPSANFPPTVDAGPDATIVQGDALVVAANVSDDGKPVSGSLTTSWRAVSGPGTVVFGNAQAATTPVTFSAGGVYVLEAAAFDGEKTTIDRVEIAVIAAGTQTAAPSVTPATGPYPGSVRVSMSSSTPGAELRYTLDGSSPGASSALYTGPFDLNADAVVRVVATRANLTQSTIVERRYVITSPNRVSDGLVALYPFNESNGAKVSDTSGVGAALDLTVTNVGRTTRVPSGLRIDQSTTITSGPADKVNASVATSGAVSVELWIEPKNVTQTNAMVFGDSANANARNFGLVQSAAKLDAYVRSTTSNSKGEVGLAAPASFPSVARTHVVYTRDADGNVRLYVNGVQHSAGTFTGSLSAWVASNQLHLGGERDGSKAWLGTYYLLAIYGRALTGAEVLQNYAFGDV